MTRRTAVTAIALTVVAVVLSISWSAARAADADCTAEIAKICPGMKPGDGPYGKCLTAHEGTLSAPCKKYAHAAAARQQALKPLPACVADAEKFCPNEPPTQMQVILCLRTHQGDLSDQCKYQIGGVTGKY